MLASNQALEIPRFLPSAGKRRLRRPFLSPDVWCNPEN
jgi:hypothetical protein